MIDEYTLAELAQKVINLLEIQMRDQQSALRLIHRLMKQLQRDQQG